MSAPVYLAPPCPACDGNGLGPASVGRCPQCGGTGAPPSLAEAMACVGCRRGFRACVCDEGPDPLDAAAGEGCDGKDVMR